MTISSTDPFPQLDDLPPLHLDSESDDVSDARRRAAEEGRRAGFAQGLFEGRAHGEAEARDEVSARAGQLLVALAEAAQDLRAHVAGARLAAGNEVVDLALQIAEAVVGRHLDLDLVGGRDALARAVAGAPGREPVVARLHPDDVASLGDVAEITQGREVTVSADPMLRRGDCVVDIGPTRVDACLSTSFDRVRAVLLGESDLVTEELS